MGLIESECALQVPHSESGRTQNLDHFTASIAQSADEPGQRAKLGELQQAGEPGCGYCYCDGMPKRPATVEVMTTEQAALLRKLAFDAYEPEAFVPTLTKAEADQRIDVLQAKLKLMGEPPHTM